MQWRVNTNWQLTDLNPESLVSSATTLPIGLRYSQSSTVVENIEQPDDMWNLQFRHLETKTFKWIYAFMGLRTLL